MRRPDRLAAPLCRPQIRLANVDVTSIKSIMNQKVCLLTENDNISICLYAYALGAVSIIFTFAIGLLQVGTAVRSRHALQAVCDPPWQNSCSLAMKTKARSTKNVTHAQETTAAARVAPLRVAQQRLATPTAQRSSCQQPSCASSPTTDLYMQLVRMRRCHGQCFCSDGGWLVGRGRFCDLV
jgi:hypothetical protein